MQKAVAAAIGVTATGMEARSAPQVLPQFSTCVGRVQLGLGGFTSPLQSVLLLLLLLSYPQLPRQPLDLSLQLL